jgi:hypothetical protein
MLNLEGTKPRETLNLVETQVLISINNSIIKIMLILFSAPNKTTTTTTTTTIIIINLNSIWKLKY